MGRQVQINRQKLAGSGRKRLSGSDVIVGYFIDNEFDLDDFIGLIVN